MCLKRAPVSMVRLKRTANQLIEHLTNAILSLFAFQSLCYAAQVEAQRGPFPGQLEMDKLRSFYDSHLRKQNLSGAGGASMTGKSSTSLSKSKLFRDLPGLENSKYLSGSRRATALGLDKASASASRSENLPAYTSDLSAGSADVYGKREEDRKRFTSDLQPAQVGLASGIEARWSSGWDQGPKANHLVPQRVPLQTLATVRCPGCRHILVKPDLKKGGSRFKIALQASLHLPEVRAHFKGVKVRTGRQSSSLNLREAEGRTRPQSMFLSAPESGSNVKASTAKDEQPTEDSERLRSGRVYDYELSFANPDFNPIAVQIAVVQSTAAMSKSNDTVKAGGEEAEPPKPFWTVQPSATRFSVKASDDMDIIDADLFGDLGLADEDDDLEEEAEEGSGSGGGTKRGKRGLGAGVLRKEGNRTVIALRLDVGLHAAEASKSDREVEVSMYKPSSSRRCTPTYAKILAPPSLRSRSHLLLVKIPPRRGRQATHHSPKRARPRPPEAVRLLVRDLFGPASGWV